MSADRLYAYVGVVLVALALYAFLVHTHLLRRLLAFNVMGGGTFLILVGLAQDGRGPDPVPQALVLTGIVVAVSATALAIILLRRWFATSQSTSLPEDKS